MTRAAPVAKVRRLRWRLLSAGFFVLAVVLPADTATAQEAGDEMIEAADIPPGCPGSINPAEPVPGTECPTGVTLGDGAATALLAGIPQCPDRDARAEAAVGPLPYGTPCEDGTMWVPAGCPDLWPDDGIEQKSRGPIIPGSHCADGTILGEPQPGCEGGPPLEAMTGPGVRCADGLRPQAPYGCPGGPRGTPTPGTRCPDGSVPAPPLDEPGCPFGLPDPPKPGTICKDGTAPRDREADRELRNILGLDETGQEHPLEAYDIGCDEGAWNSLVRKMWCGAQALPFAAGKWAIGLGIDVMDWAMEFRLASTLAPVAGLLSRIYDTSLVGPLGIRHLAWTMALFAAGWHLMRARAAQGIAEIATTFLTAALGAILLANPQGYLEGSVALAQNTSGSVLEAISDIMTNGNSAQNAEAVRARLGDILRQSFVAEPYDLINWGDQLSGQCAAARDQVLEGGPWGSEDDPRDIMRDHGCDAEADYNATPSDSRAAASLIVGLAAVVATVLLLAVALVVFIAQLTLVALFGGASLIWALALFPGARELLWWWIGRLVWAVAATIAATFTLSWLAVTVTTVLAETSDMSIIQRSLIALLVVAFGFRLRAHLGRIAETASRRFGDSVSSIGRNVQARWPGIAAAGAAGALSGAGFGFATTARSWAFDTPGGQYIFNRMYARHFTRGLRHRGGPIRSTRRALGAARDIARGGGATSGEITRGLRRTARAVALAPILGPQTYAAARVQATATSRRVRARLQGARAARQQWLTNARHPLRAMRDAYQSALPAADRRRLATARTDVPRTEPPRRRAVGWWWQTAGAPYRQEQLPFEHPGESYRQLSLDDQPQHSQTSERPRPRPKDDRLPVRYQGLQFPPLWHQPRLDLYRTSGVPEPKQHDPERGAEQPPDDGGGRQ